MKLYNHNGKWSPQWYSWTNKAILTETSNYSPSNVNPSHAYKTRGKRNDQRSTRVTGVAFLCSPAGRRHLPTLLGAHCGNASLQLVAIRNLTIFVLFCFVLQKSTVFFSKWKKIWDKECMYSSAIMCIIFRFICIKSI